MTTAVSDRVMAHLKLKIDAEWIEKFAAEMERCGFNYLALLTRVDWFRPKMRMAPELRRFIPLEWLVVVFESESDREKFMGVFPGFIRPTSIAEFAEDEFEDDASEIGEVFAAKVRSSNANCVYLDLKARS